MLFHIGLEVYPIVFGFVMGVKEASMGHIIGKLLLLCLMTLMADDTDD